jgi:dienelactone hydrolase
MTREDLTFPSGDDRCAAYLYRPAGTGVDVPCVVMAHGFSLTRDDGLPAYAERFAAAGLAALVFDYRHFGASSGEPRQLVDIRRQQADYRAAVRFARTLPGIDPGRIALWGSSFSGGHVLALAEQEPTIAAAVAQTPFADGLAGLRAADPRNAVRGVVAGVADAAGAVLGRAPRTVPAVGDPGTLAVLTAPDARAGIEAITGPGSRWRNEVVARIMLMRVVYRPAARAARIACPLLVCVAQQDTTTPPGTTIRAAERAPRGELKLYACGHFDVYRGEWLERSAADEAEFLERHLLRSSRAAAAAPADA